MQMPRLKHDLPWDPTYGYSPESLLSLKAPPAPADFDAFWSSLYQRALQVDAQPQLANERLVAGRKLFDIHYTSLDGIRIGGWLSLPAEHSPRRGLVFTHGYGGREEVDALAGQKSLFVLTAGHFTYPGQEEEQQRLDQASEIFFNENGI